MGRFDSLKENTFNSNSNSNSNRDRDRDTNRVNRDSNRVNRDTNRVNNRDSNIFKEKKQEKGYANTKENFPDLIQEVTVNKNANEGSIWLNAIKIKKEEEINKNKFIIDPNDSQYWRGGKWIGDMLLRQKQSKKKSIKTVPSKAQPSKAQPSKAHNNSSAFIIPNLGTEYSRDGINWYNSWNETFTEEELQRMEEEENKEMIQRWRDWIEDKYEQNRIESDRHYEETGELDGFALAILDRLAYEEYEKQFEMEEIEENDESDEYLEEED